MKYPVAWSGSRGRARTLRTLQGGLAALSLAVLAGCGTLDPMRDADYHAEAPTTEPARAGAEKPGRASSSRQAPDTR